ncbi:MAG: peptidoglycan DD-metalloendopeptidase family protein [Alphaproteobacteria bacterium]
MLLAFALAGVVAACARSVPAPVSYGTQSSVPIPAQKPTIAGAGQHQVTGGETIYTIAQANGVPLRALIDANQLRPPFDIYPGQVLNLPRPRAHDVVRGDTLYGISRDYGVDVTSLVQANGLRPPYNVYVGQRLRLPAPPGATIQVATAANRARAGNVPYPRLKPSAAQVAAAKVRPSTAAPPPRAASRFAWPVRGRILSRYGAKPGGLHNDGVNIAARRGDPVRAAENGVVVYVGNELKGFGNLVLIRHDDGWVSAYAHADELLVPKGATVRRGQVIAKVGASGGVDAPQLHFELRRGTRTVNPLRFLDTRQASLSGDDVARM